MVGEPDGRESIGPAERSEPLLRLTHLGGRHEQPPSPGVIAVLNELHAPPPDPSRLRAALRVLAWERVAAGGALDDTLAELDQWWRAPPAHAKLSRLSRPSRPSRSEARQWLLDGWVDAMCADRSTTCIDPLSGLHTTGYLLARIHELDRAIVGEPAALVLLAVRWREPDGPWLRIALVMRVASVLTSAVRRDATLCQDGIHTALALVPDDAAARLETVRLNREMQPEPFRSVSATVQLVPLPDDRSEVPNLLDRLHGEPGPTGT